MKPARRSTGQRPDDETWLEHFFAVVALHVDPTFKNWPNLPRTFINHEGRKLGLWLVNQRRAYKSTLKNRQLRPWRASLLEQLPGWKWHLPPGATPQCPRIE